jgi:transcriptional regulator with XRE-family HTH domain
LNTNVFHNKIAIVNSACDIEMSDRKKRTDLEQLGQRIREARERLGMTQDDLAALLGRSQDAVSSYENGSRAIRITELPVLAKVLNVSLGYLFGNEYPESEAMDLMVELMALPREKQRLMVERWRFDLDWWRKIEKEPKTPAV